MLISANYKKISNKLSQSALFSQNNNQNNITNNRKSDFARFQLPGHFISCQSILIQKTSFSSRNFALTDIEYRKALAKGLNELHPEIKCKYQDLHSIVGPQELSRVLKKAKLENFSVGGENLENVKNGKFRFNLHIHTKDSDGQYTVEGLLNDTAKYANKIKKPVYIAITNHDSINDLIKAIKILSQNKEKYKNVRLVLGAEFNAKYENKALFKKPLQLELIGYCLNPFDKRFQKFLKDIKQSNKIIAKNIVSQVNEAYGSSIKLSDIKNDDSAIRNFASPSFLYQLKKSLEKKVSYSTKNQEHMNEIFNNYIKETEDIKITSATPSMEKVVDIVNATSGFVGVAHPIRNKIGAKINFTTKEEQKAKYEEYLTTFFSDFYNAGGKSMEVNYQYKSKYLKHPYKFEKLKMIERIQNRFDFLMAGGLDSYEDNLFN